MEDFENEKENNSIDKKSNSVANAAKKRFSRKAEKQVTKNVASGAAKKSMIAALGPILAWGAIIVFAIIVITGIAVFLNTLPGMAMEKLKELGKKMANGLASWFGADSTEQVDEELVFTTLDYLDEMGYDIKGYGFLTDYKSASDASSDEYFDDDNDVIRDKESDKITDAESDFVMAYLISDNYVYTLANKNLDIDFGGGFFSWLGEKIAALGRHFIDFFGGSLGSHWTTGLITLWNEGGGIGHRGGYYSDTGFLNFDNVELDPEKRVLYLKKGAWGDNTKYKLDGWTGRYGMPMEFLLSIHIATMMPDLAYDMANSFETKLNIILHSTGDAYIPYIENVINHWYRNVYYTNVSYNKDNEEDGNSLAFIDYDYEYEDVMKERWTLYETNDEGEYLLYVLSDKLDGEYATSGEDIDTYNSSKIESKNGYYVYKGSRDDAAEEGVNVAKKAVTVSSSDSGLYDNIEWHQYGDVWVAYKSEGSAIVQTGDAMRGETNPIIKRMFLENTYFRYDGSPETAEAITALRKEYLKDGSSVHYGAINDYSGLDGADLSQKIVQVDTGDGNQDYSIADVSGKVTLNQDSMNAFSILENTNTLDADYIYKDFKELIVELGYFEKEEMTDETPRLLQWIIPDIGSYGFPKRALDKRENEFGTMAHSKLDYYAREKAIYWNEEDDDGPMSDGSFDGSNDAQERINNDPATERHQEGNSVTNPDNNGNTNVSVINYIQSVSGRKRTLLSGAGITKDFIEADMEDVDMTVRSWAQKFRKTTASDYYAAGDKDAYEEWLRKLGGVFAEYAGEDTQGEGDGDSFIDAEKYVYGLMWIAGFEYCAGTADTEPERCDPLMEAQYGDAGNNPYDAYYGYPGVGHSHIDCAGGPDEVGAAHIDKAMLAHKFTTCCNYTTDKVYYKAGLFGNGDDERPTNSCDYKTLVNEYGAQIVTEFSQLHMGDIIECFRVDNHTNPDPNSWQDWGHVLFVGEEDEDNVYLYTTGHDFTNTGDFRMRISKSASRDAYSAFPGWIGLHLWDLKVNDEKYEGYKGNEAVVSPITGILLDYGTYAESDDERINVDLKYDDYIAELQSQGIDIKYAISRQEYKEQVGYAKVMVLDAKNYLKLESGIDNSWKTDSLVVKDSRSNSYTFRDTLMNKDELKDWSAQDKTVYGYKECVEKYEKYGIAGNIIYIDGFKCETVDKSFHDAEGQYPEGDPIDLSYYKISGSELGDKDEHKKSKYKKDSKYHTVNKKEEDRINAEAEVKKKASPCVETNNLIFIKEGTVLGRTVTDRELIEKDRGNRLGTYKELREVEVDTTTDYKVIGNYIRMIMRDKQTDTVVENIEDYMKLDDGIPDKERDLRILDDFDVTDETNFPTLEEFKIMFADREKILKYAESFIAMQEKYKINAAFAACVTIIESGGGTAWDLIDPSTCNWFSIKGSYNGRSYTDRKGTNWKDYGSYPNAVDDFGNLIRNSRYYVVAGKHTVNQIGPVYCNAGWAEKVNAELKSRYQKVVS